MISTACDRPRSWLNGGMDFDVERVRASFPALADGTAYFDGPGGSQVPRQVAEAIARDDDSGISNRAR